jgi:hypothetical protein
MLAPPPAPNPNEFILVDMEARRARKRPLRTFLAHNNGYAPQFERGNSRFTLRPAGKMSKTASE